jgi:histidine ammonia-lyase
VVRRHVEFLDVDRPLFDDHNAMKALVESAELLEEVEALIGKLA